MGNVTRLGKPGKYMQAIQALSHLLLCLLNSRFVLILDLTAAFRNKEAFKQSVPCMWDCL